MKRMLKRILIGLLAVIAVALLAVVGGLTWAHMAIRAERPPLPTHAAVAASAAVADRPVRAFWINTASQAMPRSSVLDSGRDPQPQASYVMSHPSFVLEWADGRLLLIDVGMDREGARRFGARIEKLGGAAPITPLGSVAERLGDRCQQVQGVVFTHLHIDHVGGINALCRTLGHPIRVFMTEAQAERPNFTTRAGLRLVKEAECVRREPLRDGPLLGVPGFPGVFVIAAGGHTPGGQLVVAHVQEQGQSRGYLFAGDVANSIDGIIHDIPKPFLYRTLMVPEWEGRQAELRRWLRELQNEDGLTVLVSHDQPDLERRGLVAW